MILSLLEKLIKPVIWVDIFFHEIYSLLQNWLEIEWFGHVFYNVMIIFTSKTKTTKFWVRGSFVFLKMSGKVIVMRLMTLEEKQI
jgi:hypothetical protein